MSQDAKNIKIEGVILAEWYIPDWQGAEPRFIYYFERYDYSIESAIKRGAIKIAPYVIEIEIPDDIDLRKSAVKGLQKKRKLILSENEARLNKIDADIQTLLAIEHKP